MRLSTRTESYFLWIPLYKFVLQLFSTFDCICICLKGVICIFRGYCWFCIYDFIQCKIIIKIWNHFILFSLWYTNNYKYQEVIKCIISYFYWNLFFQVSVTYFGVVCWKFIFVLQCLSSIATHHTSLWVLNVLDPSISIYFSIFFFCIIFSQSDHPKKVTPNSIGNFSFHCVTKYLDWDSLVMVEFEIVVVIFIDIIEMKLKSIIDS